MVFKLKDMRLAGKTGARCDQGQPSLVKKGALELLAAKGYRIGKEVPRAVSCIVQELLMRQLTTEGGEKALFVPPSLAVLLERIVRLGRHYALLCGQSVLITSHWVTAARYRQSVIGGMREGL